MRKLPQISEAEFEVMKVVWKYAPINTNEITEKLIQTTDWSPKTIQTLIKRLVSKKALTYEKQSRVFVYCEFFVCFALKQKRSRKNLPNSLILRDFCLIFSWKCGTVLV